MKRNARLRAPLQRQKYGRLIKIDDIGRKIIFLEIISGTVIVLE